MAVDKRARRRAQVQRRSHPTATETAIGPTRLALRRRGLRRILQLTLAATWLLDAVLQLQPTMFTEDFARMLASAGADSPAAVRSSVGWAAHIVSLHPQALDALFAAVQLLLAIGIAWPRTLRPALSASIVWALIVWWFGESAGGLLTSAMTLANGAPGAALLYAIAAIILWPRERSEDAHSVACAALGSRAARVLWLCLWSAIALVTAASAHQLIPGPVNEPGWLAQIDTYAGRQVARAPYVVTAAVTAIFALATLTPLVQPRARRCLLGLTLLTLAPVWLFIQNLGGVLSGAGTDPSSAPLLALILASYWPLSCQRRTPHPVGWLALAGLPPSREPAENPHGA